MNGLSEYLAKHGVSQRDTQRLFGSLCLPVPLDEQYLETSDRGAMVFLNKFGVVLRISVPDLLEDPKEAKYRFDPVPHPDIGQPIAAFTVGKLRAELLPGLRLGWNGKHSAELKERLDGDGIDFHDASRLSNYGYLPLTNDQYPDGIPVVVDRNAARRRGPAHFTDKLHPFPPRELGQMFREAWPDAAGPAKREKMVEFWQACADLKQQNKLVAGWAKDDFKGIVYYHVHGETAEARQISFRYGRALNAYAEEHGLPYPQPAAAGR